MNNQRTRTRMLEAATADLIAAAFHEGPLYAMGFDRHVRQWKDHIGQACFIRYQNDGEFRAAFDARRDAARWVA